MPMSFIKLSQILEPLNNLNNHLDINDTCTMPKRNRETSSPTECDVIELPQRKLRKIIPIATDEINEIIDLSSNESLDSIGKNDDNCPMINDKVKLEKNIEQSQMNNISYTSNNEDISINNSALINELYSEFNITDEVENNQPIQSDNTIVNVNSELKSNSIHFADGIDDLLFDSDEEVIDKSNLINDNSVCKETISTIQQINKTTTSLSSIKNQSSMLQYNTQDSAIGTINSDLTKCVSVHFAEDFDDLLFDSDSDNDKNNFNSTKNNSVCSNNISNKQNNKTSSNLLSVENNSSKEQFCNQNSIEITTDSGLNCSDMQFLNEINDWDDDDDDDDDDDCNIDNSLDLNDYRRCQITGINRKLRFMELTVCDPELSNTAVVLCTENWRDIALEIGEFAVIKAKYSDIENKWIINNEYGICVTQCDTLVGGTSVVQGLFCNRKGILQHMYVGINCLPNMESHGAALTCGSITHELLQTALKEKVYSLPGLWKLLDRLLKLPSTITLLYISDLTVKQFKELISEYIPKIYEFISRYIEGNKPEQWDDNFAGKIEVVRDIEENIWLPTLGLKGKIDATVEVTIHQRRGIMPLELKTGRSSFSAEHKGQVYLYIMMMQMLGYDLSSGLLLYIKENIMREINSTRHEERDLILLRNMLAYYLSREPQIIDKSNDISSIKWAKWKLPELPEPIHHNTACKRCEYNTICCVYAKDDKHLSLSDSHPHLRLQKTLLRDLTPEHIDYVIHWVSLIQMESSYQRTIEKNQTIWSIIPIKREQQRTCLSYMKLVLPIISRDNMFIHKFIRDPKEKSKHLFPMDDFRKVFIDDEFVMISTDIRLNIVSGCVRTINKDSIVLTFDKDITKFNHKSYYHIDEFPSSTLPYRALGAIAAMLTDNDITRRLRRIIIDKEPATFTNVLPCNMMIGIGKNIMDQLNYYQQDAIKAVITSTDFVLIKGMPGTGKTQTLVALIEMLLYLGHSVLITAHTHVAVDNILIKLNEKNIDFLRLGSKARIHPSLRCKTDEYLMNECCTPEQLDAKYSKKNVVAVTCLGANHALLSKRIFDYCIVDECTQALQPILLRPLYNAIKFVLVGDPEQLPAVVKSSEARKLGMDEDLFTRLDSTTNTRILKQQYRMNKPIMDLANRLTYKGELLAGNEIVANETLKWKYPTVLESCEGWIKKTLSCDLKNAVVMLNTKTTHDMHLKLNAPNIIENRDDQSARCSNYIEIAIILRLLDVLLAGGINSEDIGVIAPYQAQLKLLKRLMTADIEINTVDQFQGRDKSIILLSCTRSSGESDFRKRNRDDYEILDDHKRLNVALTRAKHKLIIIGDKISLLRFTPFKKLFDILDDEIINLHDGDNDFSWHNLIQLIKENE